MPSVGAFDATHAPAPVPNPPGARTTSSSPKRRVGGGEVNNAPKPPVLAAALPINLNDDDAWRAAYVPALASLLATPASSPRESASRLSALARSGLLEFTDLKTRPDRFFLAHRLLVEHGFEQGPGFSIRFTVQFNLFAGTILELGSETHLEELTRMRRDGTLGCFALTERLAGVNSGLVVQTTATYDPTADAFVLRTPHAGATKNWISQGLTATRAVVVADLIVDGASAGLHAFLIALRRDGDAPPSRGITLTDMGTKTTGNDLDNASIAFDDVIIPRSALLDKHCDVRRDDATGRGVYGAKGDGAPASNMERIGQRLFTGRVAVAQGAHEFRKRLFARTRGVTDEKPCWAPGGGSHSAKTTLVLSGVPQLRALYVEADDSEARTGKFLSEVEKALCATLRASTRPSVDLVEAVAAAKIVAVDEAIAFTHRLRQEVGSYALMAGTGFEHTDFLQCCKFAEGDSRVLMMKVARDRVKRAATRGALPRGTTRREYDAVHALQRALRRAEERGAKGAAAWEAAWFEAYEAARVVVDATVDRWVGGETREGGARGTSKL